MSRARSLPAGLLIALTTMGLVAAGLLTTPASAVRAPLIQGVVVDQDDRPVLDVVVAAVDEDGAIVASDLSYENVTADGDPQRGYFALHVGTRGTYTVTLSKAGYLPRKISGIAVERGALHASLGEVAMTRRQAATTTVGWLKNSQVAPTERAKAVVRVTTKEAERPAGKVQVRAGGKVVGSGSLRAADRGQITVTLDRLARGQHTLRAHFLGSSSLKASESARFTLTVKRVARPLAMRPNALLGPS